MIYIYIFDEDIRCYIIIILPLNGGIILLISLNCSLIEFNLPPGKYILIEKQLMQLLHDDSERGSPYNNILRHISGMIRGGFIMDEELKG